MCVWVVEFHPPSGEKDSPLDYIVNLGDKNDSARILKRLEDMSRLEIAQHRSMGVHKIVDSIFQLRVGDYRVLFCRCDGVIAVLHVCRKRSGKTKKQDKERAVTHHNDYMAQREER